MNNCSEIRRLYVVTCFRYSFAKFPLVLLLMSVACLAMTNAYRIHIPRYKNRCGGQPMEAMVHICCNGLRQNVPLYEASACCNKTVYTTKDKMCCGGQIRYKNWFSACCGTEVYDYRASTCCNGRLQEKPYRRPACCGTEAYDGYSERCCGVGSPYVRRIADGC